MKVTGNLQNNHSQFPTNIYIKTKITSNISEQDRSLLIQLLSKSRKISTNYKKWKIFLRVAINNPLILQKVGKIFFVFTLFSSGSKNKVYIQKNFHIPSVILSYFPQSHAKNKIGLLTP